MRISSIRWGVIWIGIGLLFLAINLELLDSLVFPRLFSLWPVLLIAIGVELIFRRTRLYFLAFLSPLLIAGAFMVAATAKGDWGWESDEFWKRWVWKVDEKKIDVTEVPSDSSAKYLELTLECGTGEVTIRPSKHAFFKATTEYHKKSPWVEQRLIGDIGKIEYTNREKSHLELFGFNIAASRCDLEIADYLPVDIGIIAGDNSPNLDFSGLFLDSLNLNIHSKQTWLRFGAAVDTVDVIITGSTDELAFTIPDNYSLIIDGDSTNLHRIFKNSEFVPSGGSTYSDILRSEDVIRLSIDARIGKVSVTRD